MIIQLKEMKWQKIIKKSNLFDTKYYLFTYPDVRNYDIDPIEHFVKLGSSEGKNPSMEFNTLFYQEQYSDVPESKLPPFIHYILYGKQENRKTRNDQKTPSNQKSSSNQKDVIKQEFDTKYYLTQYPDIENASISALDHFCSTGWKEQRNPNDSFDTSFYLKANPDVQQSGINPFYHYLISGRTEGRMAVHPAGYKRTILEQTISPQEIAKSWLCELADINIKDKLNVHLEAICKNPIVISLSHDRYIDHIGGVQVCISEEQLALSHLGFSYINISPACPLPILAENENWHGDIILNNEFIGTYKNKDILSVLKNFSFKQNSSLVVHALHGHSESFIRNLYDILAFKKNFFWLHDYYTICENYNLLRNNLMYCGGPDIESQACQICAYGGKNRKSHVGKIINIFEHIPFTVIAPSQTALNIWLKRSTLPHQKAIVSSHRNIKQGKGEVPIKLSKNEPLRIAFLGHGALHKGWHVFKSLVERYKDDKRYEFYHLGINTNDKSCSAKFYQVKNNWKNMTDMQNMIREKSIHVSFLWSIWPETYNIVTYEALASGSTILTNNLSGNIAVEINKTNQGLVLDSENKLFEMFKNGKIRSEIESIFGGKMLYGSLKSSDITTAFISQKEIK